jgi:uncharacterized protein
MMHGRDVISMPVVEARESELRERLTAILRETPPLMRVLTVARRLCLPDWLVFSGAVYQPVLNHLTGRPFDYGIKDYDLAYFDASNLSYEAEAAVIHQVKAAFDEPLRSMVEVRNQARVHLWFEAKFGEPYTPLSCTAEALERFASATFACQRQRENASAGRSKIASRIDARPPRGSFFSARC